MSSEVTVCCVSLVAVVSWEKVVSGLGDTIDIVDTLLFPKDILFKDKKSIEIWVSLKMVDQLKVYIQNFKSSSAESN